MDEAVKSATTVYVTQHGYAVVVLLSRDRYDDLLTEVAHAREMAERSRTHARLPGGVPDVACRQPFNDPETSEYLTDHGFDPDSYIFDE